MTKKVHLVIKGEQSGFGEKDTSEIVTTADYYLKGGKHYLFYSEYTEERQIWKNRLTIDHDHVELKKTGPGNSQLLFREGQSEKCFYQSPVGPMELVSDTKKIQFHCEKDSLKLTLIYSLYMNGMLMSDYHLTVKANSIIGE
ncbi:MAG: DUF1934 domain-containing protein [Lachnospiraceae bacterium]|nr:DUF1934 domain-containing protein [Lachnospiraceae bacterium]